MTASAGLGRRKQSGLALPLDFTRGGSSTLRQPARVQNPLGFVEGQENRLCPEFTARRDSAAR